MPRLTALSNPPPCSLSVPQSATTSHGPEGCTVILNGSLDASDPTQTGRVFRDGFTHNCGDTPSCSVITAGSQFHYDSYTFTNTTGSTQCVGVFVDAMTCTGGQFLYAVAYLGSFDPANICTNFLSAIGSSPNPTGSFSFNLAAGQTFVLVISEVTANSGCAGYRLEVTGPACPVSCNDYAFAAGRGSIVPGTTDTGNRCDDCSTVISLPFPVTLYDQTFTSAAVGSNGHLTFGTVSNSPNPACIPNSPATYIVAPYWTDQCTGDCTNVVCSGCGIFTSTTGAAPNRVFQIEYRTAYYNSGGTGVRLNYEVRLFEGKTNIDVVYGTINSFTPPNARNISVGVQKNAAQYTLVGCDTTGGQAPPVNAGQKLAFTFDCLTPFAVSRKVHGAAGTFNVGLPLAGMPGIECRSGGATNDYQIVAFFPNPVTVSGTPQAQVSFGAGTVGSGGVSNGGIVTVSGNTVTVPLTNVSDAQTLNVTISGLNNGVVSGNALIPMSRLLGDANGNGAVNAGDVAQTKSRIGQPLSAANFRSDFNESGGINAGDVAIVKANTGHGLP